MNKTLAAFAIVSVLSIAAQTQTVAPSPTPMPSVPPQHTTPQSPEIEEANRLTEQAARLYGERKYDEALPLAQRVVEIRERALGGQHQLVGIALFNVASILAEKRDFSEAERIYRRALPIYENNLGANNPRIANILDGIGMMCLVQGKDNQAEEAYQRALTIREAVFGAEHVETSRAHFNLGRLYYQQGRREQAERSYRRALTIVEARLGANHPDVATVLESLVILLRQENRNDQANTLQERVLAIRGASRPPGASQRVVDGGVLTGRVIRRVEPHYPEGARALRVSGAVVVEITVDENGDVSEARAVMGHPNLRLAAVQAVRQWKFSPTRINDMPVRVTGRVVINFTLP